MFSTSARRLWFFVIVSALAHAALFSELPALMGLTSPEPVPLTAEIAMPDPVEAPKPPPATAPPLPKKIAAVPRLPPAPRVIDTPVPTPDAAQVARPIPPSQPEPEAPAAPADAAVDSQAMPEAPAEPPLAPPPEPPAPTLATSAPPIRDLPPAGKISFEVHYGRDKFPIGRTLLTWALNAESYRLTSIWETTGLAGFFRPFQLSYVSEGRVDAIEGLRPASFLARRGRNGERQAAAQFDWPARKLTLGPPAAPQSVALPPGTLDRLSFIYQLARSDLSPRRTELRITDGNKLDTYTLEIGAAETIELPLGSLLSVPIRQIRRPGQESIEIWIAPDQHYLPVRIRHFDREGRFGGEQVATEISTDAP